MYEPYGGGAGEAFENTAVSHQCSLFTHSSNIVHTYPYPSLCSSASSLYFNSRYARRAWHTQTLRSLVQLPCSLQLSLRSRGMAHPNPSLCSTNSLASTTLAALEGHGPPMGVQGGRLLRYVHAMRGGRGERLALGVRFSSFFPKKVRRGVDIGEGRVYNIR